MCFSFVRTRAEDRSKMWRRISLRFRIYVLLGAIVFITLMGGLVLVWYTFRMEGLLITITKKNLAALQAAEALETTLINQKGFVSYYIIDGDPNWLRQLARYRRIFQDLLKTLWHGNPADRRNILFG